MDNNKNTGITDSGNTSKQTTAQPKEESFAKLVRKSTKQQAAFILAFVLIMVIILGTVFALTQLSNNPAINPVYNADKYSTKTCVVGSLGFTFSVPADWNWDCRKENHAADDKALIISDAKNDLKIDFYYNDAAQVPSECENPEAACTSETVISSHFIQINAEYTNINKLKQLDQIWGGLSQNPAINIVNIHFKEKRLPTAAEKQVLQTIFDSLTIADVTPTRTATAGDYEMDPAEDSLDAGLPIISKTDPNFHRLVSLMQCSIQAFAFSHKGDEVAFICWENGPGENGSSVIVSNVFIHDIRANKTYQLTDSFARFTQLQNSPDMVIYKESGYADSYYELDTISWNADDSRLLVLLKTDTLVANAGTVVTPVEILLNSQATEEPVQEHYLTVKKQIAYEPVDLGTTGEYSTLLYADDRVIVLSYKMDGKMTSTTYDPKDEAAP